MARMSASRLSASTIAIAVILSAIGCQSPGGGGLGGGGGGVPWTILALEVEQGPYSVKNAERMAESLRAVKGIKPKAVRVSHDPDGTSRVYYGRYPTRTDPKTGRRIFPPQMDKDLKLIKFLRFEDGTNYFALASRVREPQPDVGDPAWSLKRAERPYTLQVAIFEADVVENSKESAAKWCEALRRRGYEAYYYHASVSSMVTVGAFGKEDVRLDNGRLVYGNRIRKLQEDEALRYNYVNGEKVFVIDNGQRVPVPSQVMLVPGHEDEQLMKDATFSPTGKGAKGE